MANSLAGLINRYQHLEQDNPQSWPGLGNNNQAQKKAGLQALQSAVNALPRQHLSFSEKMSTKVLTWRLNTELQALAFHSDRIAFDNGDGFFNTATYTAQVTRIQNPSDAQHWLDRLQQLPAYYQLQMARMQKGIDSGFTQPKPTVTSVINILSARIKAPLTQSPLLEPIDHSTALSAAQKAQWRDKVVALLAAKVRPSEKALLAFFKNQYLPHARPKLAARSLPNGERYYPFLVRKMTTTDMTPAEVFALGQGQIKVIRAKMQAILAAQGFDGSVHDYAQKLLNDPNNFAADLPTFIKDARAVGKQLDYLLPRYFGRLPRLTWGIEQKPPSLDASSGGYFLGDPKTGNAGAVMVGTQSYHDPLFSLPAWVMHEGVPGHHLQIALAQENSALPFFQRSDDVTAFVEGWALYSETLGNEMGIYDTPAKRFGQLSMQMWRACRLVMDTGIHWYGWSAAKARQCLADNTALPAKVIDGEVQRYIAWPGQALAYYVGQMAFEKARQRAQAALGDKFDIRAFHDAVLQMGSVPLTVLSAVTDHFIATGGRDPYSTM
ncbi:DUF885 domain-containing protein [Gallaecimonas mangrovi]|uniref:DUF885 domain-containing protein n=1 Tax=Gallaecimonas mangrovi TaxID=2291597 RepID=UPI001866D809|nr:DUF885 domain-containing protein [Gallaecimonas mangrovi]